MATLGHSDTAFMTVRAGPPTTVTCCSQAALGDMVSRLPVYSTQGIANVLWAGGALGVAPGPVLRPVVPALIARMAEFSSQELSNVLLGLAKMQVFEPTLVQVRHE